jgi:hypothetical protein
MIVYLSERGGIVLTKREFEHQLDNIYQEFRIIPLRKFSTKLYIEMEKYINENYIDDEKKIHIYDYEIEDDNIFLNTNIGTFLLSVSLLEKMDLFDLEKFSNKDYNILDFFNMLSCNTYSDDHIRIRDYLNAYYLYRMIVEKNVKRLFKYNYNQNIFTNNCLIPLEVLDNSEYNSYIYTTEEYVLYLKGVYDYYKFDNNKRLMFAMIILANDKKGINYIRENIEEFKNFILNETISSAFNNKYSRIAYNYVKDNDLLKIFSKEELKQMYIANVRYFEIDEEVFEPIARNIKNSSPMIKLYSGSNKLVHIKYFDYDLCQIEEYSKEIPAKLYKLDKEGEDVELNFFRCFLFNNELVVKLYKKYYKIYEKSIKDNDDKDNLYDFIKAILTSKAIINNIYCSDYFNINDIKILNLFVKYYDKKIQEYYKKISNDLKIQGRNNALNLHNYLVINKADFDKIDNYLKDRGLNETNIFSYVINNKFLASKEKEGVLSIINNYYGNGYMVIDIFLLLDEMVTRDMTIEEILKEKEISKRDFDNLYEIAKESNPMLYQYIFKSLNNNKRRGFIKLIRLGYRIINSKINSVDEYNKKFGTSMDIYDLLFYLDGTDVGMELYNKVKGFEKFDSSKVRKKTK